MTESSLIQHAHAVDCVLEPRAWDWAVANDAAIQKHWDGLKAANPALFDGEVLVLHRGGIEGGVFRGAYLKTRYSRFITARDWDFPDGRTRNAFAMGALRAADGAFLLGIMGAHTANPGKIYFAAGTPDPSDVVDGRVDLGGSVVRELEEETGLSLADVRLGDDWSVVSHGSRVALMRRVEIPWPAEEARALIERNIRAQEDPELAGIHIVRGQADILADRMPPFMQSYLRWAMADVPQPAG